MDKKLLSLVTLIDSSITANYQVTMDENVATQDDIVEALIVNLKSTDESDREEQNEPDEEETSQTRITSLREARVNQFSSTVSLKN